MPDDLRVVPAALHAEGAVLCCLTGRQSSSVSALYCIRVGEHEPLVRAPSAARAKIRCGYGTSRFAAAGMLPEEATAWRWTNHGRGHAGSGDWQCYTAASLLPDVLSL